MDDEIVKPSTGVVTLGELAAERAFSLFRANGDQVPVRIRLGKPYREETLGDYRCPLQVSGLGDERIYAPWGEDAFVALQYALDLIGQLLDAALRRQQLQDRKDRASTTESRWIWRYPADCRQARD